ncbi:MAG: RIP metalloprotease RseP [Candidatus Eiseniibacteriota bacterium]|jgi:regulator of sigma E protease
MSILIQIAIGLFFLSVLVVFHELGHFLVARGFGVRVDRFSVGFGKSLVQWRRGPTTWSIAAVPLGGYVRMAGEHPDDEGLSGAPDEFLSKPWWQRLLIVVAGPAANLVFATIAFCLIGVVGIDVPLQDALIETVGPPARAAGFRPGDDIVAVGNTQVDSWYDFQVALGEQIDAGAAPAITVARNGKQQVIELTAEKASDVIGALDIWVAPVIGRVPIGNPAYQAGVRSGDRVVAVDGEPIDSWNAMRVAIESRPDQDVELDIERDGRRLAVNVHTLSQEGEDGQAVGRIGIVQDSPTRRVTLPLAESVEDGLMRTRFWTGFVYSSLLTLVTDISSVKDNVAGPITIVQIAGSTLRPAELLRFLAIISISLMAINLLPIPILDGGHALFCVIEGVRGAPLEMRTQLAFQKVGLVIIGTLLIMAVFNDVRRGWERFSSVQRLEQQQEQGP